MVSIAQRIDPFPEDPVHEPTDLFQEEIGDRPTLQRLEEVHTEEYPDHFATRLANFRELTMSHVSVKVGQHHPAHFHTEGPHAIFVISGTGMIRVGDEQYDISAGSFVIVPANVPHFTRNTGSLPLNYVQLVTPSR